MAVDTARRLRVMNDNPTQAPVTSVFSEEWVRAWCHALNASAEYRASASSWKWPIVVVAENVAAWYLDLHRGQCRSVRAATAADRENTDYVIAGPLSAWEEILCGQSAPLVAIMQGKLRLEKGSMVKLSRYAAAAKNMLDAAVDVTGRPAPAEGREETTSAPKTAKTTRSAFRTTSEGGIDRDSFPMQLYHKAKKLGVWDPADIDFGRDREDWLRLAPDEKDVLLRLISMFQAGEEAVTLDLLPLIRTIASEGRIEEEMYLTTFLFEEAKHTEFFRAFLDDVTETSTALDHYHTPAYRELFYRELPAALSALDHDSSPRAQLEASATYNMIVEGTLAETGYHALYRILDERGILPGLREGTKLLQRDESRHIAYGVFLITRLIGGNPDLTAVFHERMNHLLPIATTVISELFAAYDRMPFGLREEDFLDFAL
ncbi:MAG: R2-like ligand-binding oxidase, partial [Rhodothermales bacterium]|nr:R2-like ligand-binding oxidase [Rhodothermales bacterium]